MTGMGFGWVPLLLGTKIDRAGPWLGRLAHIPGWTLLLWIWDGICGFAVAIAVSVLLLQMFRLRRCRWLFVAVLAGACQAILPPLLSLMLGDLPWPLRFLVRAGMYATLGAAGLWAISSLCDMALAGRADISSA